MEEHKDYTIEFDNYCISIGYHPQKNITIEIYKEFGEDVDILNGKKKSAELIAKHKHLGYIADMRNFKGASPDAADYVANTWFPEVYKQGLRYGALLFGEDLFSVFAVETAVTNDFAKSMVIEKFLTMKAAEDWLIEMYKKHKE